MAARLARSKATVTTLTEDGEPRELQHVSVLVRDNVATLRLGADMVLRREGVARVVPLARRSWTLQFEDQSSDADVWTITDERRSCCGGR